jgi:hypothetical protein
MIVPAPPPKPLNAGELVVGKKYWTPSGMGGVYTVIYQGVNDGGKHIFEYEDRGTMDMISEMVPRLIQVCYDKMTLEEYLTAGRFTD